MSPTSDTSTTRPLTLPTIWYDDGVWFAELPPRRGYGQGANPSEAAQDLFSVLDEWETQ